MAEYTGMPALDAANPLLIAGILQETLVRKGISAMVALAWEGPQLDTYSVSLGWGVEPQRIDRAARALALAAGSESCRVAQVGGKLYLELAKAKERRKPLLAARLETLKLTSSASIVAGIRTGGKPLWVNLDDEAFAHIAIGGTTGSGKSVLLRWILYRLAMQNPPERLRMLLIDPKGYELKAFRQSAHLAHPVTANPVDAARLLSWVVAEIDRRAASGRNRPRLVVAVDEVAYLVKANRALTPLLANIAQIGRALGITLIISTQQPGLASLGQASINFPCRLIGRIASATLTYGAAGRARSGADALLGKGDFVCVAAGETDRFQAPLVDDSLLARIPQVEQVASLDDEMPSPVRLADLSRDPRGGRGGRELSEADYQEIEAALDAGLSVEQIETRWGIGWNRAKRMRDRRAA